MVRATPTEPQSGVRGQTLTARIAFLHSNSLVEIPWEHPRRLFNPQTPTTFCQSPPSRNPGISLHSSLFHSTAITMGDSTNPLDSNKTPKPRSPRKKKFKKTSQSTPNNNSDNLATPKPAEKLTNNTDAAIDTTPKADENTTMKK
ncbi:hypothetical protein PGT21_036489 [Puccinia graminis f. sp. tritici]|uniref:Uncharacterized protein n=1 Tax=Puccinia graminis f. sp. tritici TaxID=56615 RepID=A0A5B0NGN5_PUCGR|nr:hypothetical protein PGT21_036489 [Puccinia graminis f. sp. tritici]KAA1138137.1 hypothetical protein PGTUg99_005922 [Puccinia graminis f. sp. tritici]